MFCIFYLFLSKNKILSRQFKSRSKNEIDNFGNRVWAIYIRAINNYGFNKWAIFTKR